MGTPHSDLLALESEGSNILLPVRLYRQHLAVRANSMSTMEIEAGRGSRAVPVVATLATCPRPSLGGLLGGLLAGLLAGHLCRLDISVYKSREHFEGI